MSLRTNLKFNKMLDKKLKNVNYLSCMRDDIINNDITVKKRIGTPSIQGEVFLAQYDNLELVIKKIPLTQNFFKQKKLTTNVISYSGFLTELLFLECCKILIKRQTTPFLPYIYNFSVCDEDCMFKNKKITKQYSHSGDNSIKGCGFLMVEKADGDFYTFLKEKTYTFPQLLIICYQIFSGLLMMKATLNLYHGDLHQGNVLFKTMDNQVGFIKIKSLTDKIHYIPSIGVKFFVWDFGSSRAVPFISNSGYDHIFKNFEHIDDFLRIINALDENSTQKKVRDALKSLLIKSTSILDFLDLVADEIHKIRMYTPKKDKILYRFNMDNGKYDTLFKAYNFVEKTLSKHNS